MAGPVRVAVLLGAGASADAGIPTTVEMTDAVISRMSRPEHRLVLEFVRHTIAADLASRGQGRGTWSADVRVDVERLFASIDLLVDRTDQPWSPFVADWHPGLEGFGAVPTVSRSDIFSDLRSFESALDGFGRQAAGGSHPHSGGARAVSDALAKVVEQSLKRARPKDASKLLSSVRTAMLRSLFEVVRIDEPQRAEYLSPLIELAAEQGSLTIATLNYDRSIENAAELVGVSCDTGIETWLARGELEWGEKGLRLLKLHGSIDWVAQESHERGNLPLVQIHKVESEDEKARYERPAVVFGEAGKLRSEGPYIELLLSWAAELRRADTMLVVGYSFRDQHVNEVIARWFNADRERRLILVDPADVSNAPRHSFARQLGWVDEEFPGQVPLPRRRFEQIIGRTGEVLLEGIKTAARRP